MYKDIFLFLAKILYPNGRAWNLPESDDMNYVTEDEAFDYCTEADEGLYEGTDKNRGIFYRLHRALSVSIAQAYADARSTIDSTIADNPNFTEDDATAWETRLGLITNTSTSLADRILAINQKYNYPGNNKYRQHQSFIEAQLRAAGFDVHVYQNRFAFGGSYISKTPSEVLGVGVGTAAYGMFGYGELGYGDTLALSGVTKVVNYLEEEKDELFAVAVDGYGASFFIAGATITTFADVPASRKMEFRQLISQLKEQQGIGFLFVNYV